jgi:DNA-binding XRE family transcriptional regulator
MTPAEKLARTKPKPKSTDRRMAKWRCTVADYRTRLRLTHRDVCSAIGVSTGFLVGIERGEDVRLTNAVALAAFFGATIQDLWPERL